MFDVVALGELLIDFVYAGKNEIGYPTMQSNPGGAPANFLCTLSKFGLKTAFIGKVGNDAFGNLLVNTLNDGGIDTSGIIKDDSYFTTLAFVTLDETGDRNFSFARKPGADTMLLPNELNKNIIENTKIFHFGTLSLTSNPSKESTIKALNLAKDAGAIITFDPNYRSPLWESEKDAMNEIKFGLKNSDIVKISLEELNMILNGSIESMAHKLITDFDIKLAFITLGEKGCFFINKNASGFVDSFNGLKIIDTTGAGDIFGGAAIFQILKLGILPEDLKKEDLVKIVRFSNAAAYLSTTKNGGIPSIPSKQEVDEFLNGF